MDGRQDDGRLLVVIEQQSNGVRALGVARKSAKIRHMEFFTSLKNKQGLVAHTHTKVHHGMVLLSS